MGHRRLSRKANGGFFFRRLFGGGALGAPRAPGPLAGVPSDRLASTSHAAAGLFGALPAPSGAAAGRQGRWPLDASSRSPQTPGEQHWPLGYLISPNTPRHGPNSVVDQQLPGHWPRPRAAKSQAPSKTPGERPAKTPGNAPETRKHGRFAPGVRQNARRPGVPGVLGVPFWGWKCGDCTGRRDDGTTGRRDDGELAAAADLLLMDLPFLVLLVRLCIGCTRSESRDAGKAKQHPLKN